MHPVTHLHNILTTFMSENSCQTHHKVHRISCSNWRIYAVLCWYIFLLSQNVYTFHFHRSKERCLKYKDNIEECYIFLHKYFSQIIKTGFVSSVLLEIESAVTFYHSLLVTIQSILFPTAVFN